MTRTNKSVAVGLLVAALAVAMPSLVVAQDTAAIDKAIHDRWAAILADVARAHGQSVEAGRLASTVTTDARRLVYRDALNRLADDPELQKLAVPDLALVTQKTPASERRFIEQLEAAGAEHTQPKSVNATSTNPAAGSIVERSGFTELIALALNSQTFFNADDTAVSLNLNALAVFSLADPEVYSELYRYQQHSLLRRIGGTVVFGAKIPEKEITGISGLPEAETLLDAFTWDVKVRVFGDKDPRARKWYDETLGRFGVLNQLNVIQNDVSDPLVLTEELNRLLGERLTTLKRRINRSPQVTVKTSGTHLTKETGRNKYTVGLLYDQGFGTETNVTANLLYAITDDVRMGAENLFQVKQLTFNGALTAKLARNAIVEGRTIDWSNGITVNAFVDKAALPIDVTNTWKLFTKVEIPFGDAASIPLSIVYTNDRNELAKTNYVTGFVGVTYDFSAVSKLVKSDK